MRGETSKKLIGPLAYHRNGVGGEGFHVALVEEIDGDETRRMVVIRAKDADKHTGSVNCFVLDVDKAAAGDVQFFTNSWCGDHYADFMDTEIDKRDREIEVELDLRLPGKNKLKERGTQRS